MLHAFVFFLFGGHCVVHVSLICMIHVFGFLFLAIVRAPVFAKLYVSCCCVSFDCVSCVR